MTINQLIEKLKRYNGESLVAIGYTDECDVVYEIEINKFTGYDNIVFLSDGRRWDEAEEEGE